MWDKRGVTGALSMTGTNTLTIEIGDVNDNFHGPGTQNIHVYNYLGKFYNVFISCFLFLACIRNIMTWPSQRDNYNCILFVTCVFQSGDISRFFPSD